MLARQWLAIVTVLTLISTNWLAASRAVERQTQNSPPAAAAIEDAGPALVKASAVFAGGCFWCIESDLERLPGVSEVISGYSGGRSKLPSYQTYAAGGHREVVFVVYDPQQITYAGLVEYLLKHIDPLNRYGQFKDKGLQYSPAIYYATAEEKAAAEQVIQAIDAMRIYRGKIGVSVEPRKPFWPAEEEHQDYHVKNGAKYQYYRLASGRDAFVLKHWGPRANALELPGAVPDASAAADDAAEGQASGGPAGTTPPAVASPWLNFSKPEPAELRRRLTPLQYKVTQQDGTEPAFRNEYWNNKHDGIYVDVVSGAPLFSSHAKYDSGTGWPSFVAPIEGDALLYKHDHKMSYARIEVRSRHGDSHLGHVFDDGPPAMGGKRYCMNSAALRFVPVEQMEQEGYGDYLKLFSLQP